MKCPHCQTNFHRNMREIHITTDRDVSWDAECEYCPACKKAIVQLIGIELIVANGKRHKTDVELSRRFIVPSSSMRPNPPSEVPADLAKYYIQASHVLADSPMASAALSRRCLQHLIRDTIKIADKDLAPAIDKLLALKVLPSHLAEAVDVIRNIGNFAAHPMKSTSSGEILEVETGEAEWNLDVLDGLFDFYFVQPAILEAKKDALNSKLKSAGKPPIK